MKRVSFLSSEVWTCKHALDMTQNDAGPMVYSTRMGHTTVGVYIPAVMAKTTAFVSILSTASHE